MRLRQRAAEDGEVLREDEDQPAVDGPVPCHHAVTRDPLLSHAEVGAAMLDEHVGLFERAWIEQQFQPLAGAELAARMLRLDPLGAAAKPRPLPLLLQPLDDLLHDARSSCPAAA